MRPTNAPIPPQKPKLPYLPWIIASSVSLLAVYVWGRSFAWNFPAITTYQLFPLLGLLAFSIMWSHYITALLRRLGAVRGDLHQFFRWTGYLVLLAIIFHPGLLIYQRFHDGYGLPPGSYRSYVAPGLAWIVTLGSVCWLAFIAFEFRRWFQDRSWWQYVTYASDAAMLGIFYHGLRLGSQLQVGWYKVVWIFYGLLLIVALVYKYYQLLQSKGFTHKPLFRLRA